MVENAKGNGPVPSEDLGSNNEKEPLLKNSEQHHEELKIITKHQINTSINSGELIPERSGLEVKQSSLVGPPLV